MDVDVTVEYKPRSDADDGDWRAWVESSLDYYPYYVSNSCRAHTRRSAIRAGKRMAKRMIKEERLRRTPTTYFTVTDTKEN